MARCTAACAGISRKVRKRRAAGACTADYLLLLATGPIMAGATSCSYAANVAARRASSMLGTFLTASGFSPAASAPASPISPRWATVGIARRVGSRNYARGFNGKRVAPCPSGREGCTSGPTTRLLENGRELRPNTGQISTALICGGSVEAGLQCSVDGQSANFHMAKQKQLPCADQYRAHLWRQCRSRFAELGGWPVR